MWILFLVALMIALDQVVKYWAATVLAAEKTISIIPNIFHLTYVENRGAAFSMLMNKRWFFVILAICVVGFIVYAIKKGWIQTKLGRISLYFVTAGAIGNVIDRVVRGYVIDLFDFRLIHFPVFNIADIFVCIGGALFAFYIIFQHKDKEKN